MNTRTINYKSPDILKMMDFINLAESTYSSWMRNMIIIVGAGIAVHKLHGCGKVKNLNIYIIGKKYKINAIGVMSIMLVIGGLILGILTLYTYHMKIIAARNIDYEELYNIYFKNKIIGTMSVLITIIYLCLIFVTGLEFIHT